MRDESSGPFSAFARAWSEWQRKPDEALTSDVNVSKALGVLAARYLYGKWTSAGSSPDAIAASAASIAALVGLAIPAPDVIEQRRSEFGRDLARVAVHGASDEALAWFTSLDATRQAGVAQLFQGDSAEQVAAFLSTSENRERVARVLAMSVADFISQARRASGGVNAAAGQLTTLDQGALLTGAGLGDALRALMGGQIRCRVRTEALNLRTKYGTVELSTNRIVRLHVFPPDKPFGSRETEVTLVDGSVFKGKLLTKSLEVDYGEGVSGLTKIPVDSIGSLKGVNDLGLSRINRDLEILRDNVREWSERGRKTR